MRIIVPTPEEAAGAVPPAGGVGVAAAVAVAAGVVQASAADIRLAAEMFCMEHGARVVGPDMSPAPAPHDPWPTVTLRPITAEGQPSIIHYRPVLGIVYYTLGNYSVERLVLRVAALMSAAGDGHLRKHRAVAATPTSVLRVAARVHEGRLISGPVTNVESEGHAFTVPARCFTWSRPHAAHPPPHFSDRAAFTWVFIPVETAADRANAGFSTMAEVNAVVAAIFYDGGRICSAAADGDDRPQISAADFVRGETPAVFRNFVERGLLRDVRGVLEGGPVGPDGNIINHRVLLGTDVLGLRGNKLVLLNWAYRIAPGVSDLPELAWDPAEIQHNGAAYNPGSRNFRCRCCWEPVWGTVVALRWSAGVDENGDAIAAGTVIVCQTCVARYSSRARIEFLGRCALPGTAASEVEIMSLLGKQELCDALRMPGDAPKTRRAAEEARMQYVLCTDGTQQLLRLPAAAITEPATRAYRTTVGLSRIEVEAACGSGGCAAVVAAILAGEVAPIEGIDNAFVLSIAESAEKIVLAGSELGCFAHMIPAVAALRLRVLAGLKFG